MSIYKNINDSVTSGGEIHSVANFLFRHYGDNLDGCGLDLEGKVRKSYYTFLRRLLDSVRSFTGDPDDERLVSV